MREHRYHKGRQLIVEGVRMRVRGRSADGGINLEEAEGGRFLAKTEDELLALWNDRKVEFIDGDQAQKVALQRVQDTNFEAQTEASKEFARWIQPYVAEFARRRMRFTSSKPDLMALIDEVYPTAPNRRLRTVRVKKDEGTPKSNEEKKEATYGPPNWKALSRVLKRWEAMGRPDPADLRLFLPDYRGRGNREARFTTEQEEVIDRVIRSHIMKRRRRTAVEAADEVEELLLAASLLPPKSEYADRDHYVSARTIERRVGEKSQYEKTLAWKGKSAAGQLFPVMSVSEPRMPLAVVEFDFHKSDMIAKAVWGEDGVGRPVVAAAIDVFSRCYAGILPVIGAPSEVLLLRLLKMVILPKFEFRALHPEIKTPWEVEGKPDLIRLDNALEHHAGSFRSACAALGINVEWCEKKKPKQRPFIERSFGTFARGLVHHLPATTMANTKERTDTTPETDPKLDVAAVEKIVPWWVCDVYHLTTHEGIGMPPLEKYREGVATYPTSMDRSRDEIDRICSLRFYVPLTREGVRIDGLSFNSRDRRVFELLNDPDKPKKCLVLVNPDCLDQVLLRDWHKPEDDQSAEAFVPLESLDPDLTTGVTLDLARLHLNAARNKKKAWQRVYRDDLRASKKEMEQFVKDRIKEGKAVGKRLHGSAKKVTTEAEAAARTEAERADRTGAPVVPKRAGKGDAMPPAGPKTVDRAALAAKMGFAVDNSDED